MSKLEHNNQNVIPTNDNLVVDNKTSTDLNITTNPEYINKRVIWRYLQNKSIHAISREFYRKDSIITKILEDAGVIILDKSKKTNTLPHLDYKFWIDIKPELYEVIIGELLGDGYLGVIRDRINGKKVKSTNTNRPSLEEYKVALDYLSDIKNLTNIPDDLTKYIQQYNYAMNIISSSRITFFALKMTIKSSEWVQYVGTILDAHQYPCKMKERVSKKLDKKTNTEKEYEQIQVTSVNSIQLGKLYDAWYPEGVKIILKNFALTSTILLHFFIGDGYATKMRLVDGTLKIYSITFCTDCFTYEDCNYLAEVIGKAVHAVATLNKKKKRNKKIVYRIIIQGYENVKKFYTYIDKANPASVALAKKIFPWKFEPILKKEYLEKIKAQNGS